MKTFTEIVEPTICIVHFESEEVRGKHMVCYQVVIDQEGLSPTGDFIRFNHHQFCEVHGWKKVDDLVIDEVLRVLDETETENWRKVA